MAWNQNLRFKLTVSALLCFISLGAVFFLPDVADAQQPTSPQEESSLSTVVVPAAEDDGLFLPSLKVSTETTDANDQSRQERRRRRTPTPVATTVPPTATPTATSTPAPTSVPTSVPTAAPTATPVPTGDATTWWQPSPDQPIAWHWQLSQQFSFPRDVIPGVTVYDIDGELTSAETVAQLHALGPEIKVICYIDAGVFEDYRSDAGAFPPEVIGNPDEGWDGSYWLDIRRIDILKPIMERRIKEWCADKGFDAVEPDETEVWSNDSGFNITKAENNAYNIMIAELAHKYGLSVGLKGNTTETGELVDYFDWTLNEECWQYDECDLVYESFILNGKAAFNIEYAVNPNCAQANEWHMNSTRRDLNLVGPTRSAYRFEPCIPYGQTVWE